MSTAWDKRVALEEIDRLNKRIAFLERVTRDYAEQVDEWRNAYFKVVTDKILGAMDGELDNDQENG